MYSEDKIAFIETAMQCIFLKSLYPNKSNIDIFFIKRKKWPNKLSLFMDYFSNTNKLSSGIFYALYFLIKTNKKYNHIIVGSHLGMGNRLLILIGLFLNCKVTVLDDGLYSVFFKKWMNFIAKFTKKFKWASYYNRDLRKKFLINYCLIPFEKKYTYENSYFLVLSDMIGRGVSEEKEIYIIKKIKKYAEVNNKVFIIIPHRRGRYQLYRKLNLEILASNEICFEDWYLKSEFKKNCRIFSSGSSIWQIFEDRRVQTTLLDSREGNINWIKKNCYVDQYIDLN